MHQISKIYFVIKLYMFRAHNLHEKYQLPCVQQITPDDGHRRRPKHVEFYDKINFGYLMHLVRCFIRNLSRCTVT
jgi:hypothetical protein